MEGTICGVTIGLFADDPTPRELAGAVGQMNSEKQAEFFIELGEKLRFACGGKLPLQLQYIADALNEMAEKNLCGYGHDLLLGIADRLKRE